MNLINSNKIYKNLIEYNPFIVNPNISLKNNFNFTNEKNILKLNIKVNKLITENLEKEIINSSKVNNNKLLDKKVNLLANTNNLVKEIPLEKEILDNNKLNNKLNKKLKLNKNLIQKDTINLYSYINILSKFNSKLANNQFIFYNFNKGANKSISYIFLFNKAINILKLTFLSMGCLISRPIFKIVYTKNNLEKNYTESYLNNNNKKIIIQLFYYVKYRKRYNINSKDKFNSKLTYKNIYTRYSDKFEFLNDFLTNLFESEVELEVIRLNKPYYNSNILVQHLAIQSYKNRFVRLVSRLFRKMNIFYNKTKNFNNLNQLSKFNLLLDNNNEYSDSFPSFLSGINIKLAGRTFKQKVIPKRTVKQTQKGVLSHEKVKFIEKSRFVGKTKRGSYSFTVTLGHIL